MSTSRSIEASRPIDPVRAMLSPESVLVIGASGATTALSGVVMHSLKRFGFPGRVLAVNPKYDSIQGFDCYASLDDIPGEEAIDLAIIALGRDKAPATLRHCGEMGVRSAVIISAGFAELGGRGAALQEELRQVADEFGLAVCGPNCAGLANFSQDFVAYGTNNFLELEEILVGGTAIITASGGLGNTIFSYLQDHRVGCSKLVSIGNEAVTTSADYLRLFSEDSTVDTVVAYLEAIRDPDRFFEAVDLCIERGKPVIVLKPGRSRAGQDAIRTHTAALGGSYEAHAAWFERHGVVVVEDIDELAEAVVAFQRISPITGTGVGIFSLPGGGLALLSDSAETHGFSVPEISASTRSSLQDILPDLAVIKNPLDPSSGFRDSTDMGEALVRFASDPSIDVVVFFPLVSNPGYAEHIVDQLIDAKTRMDCPLVCIWTVSVSEELRAGPWRRLRDAGVALYTRIAPAFAAMERLWRTGEYRLVGDVRAHTTDKGPSLIQPHSATAGSLALEALPHDPGPLLDAYGFRRPMTAIVNTVDDAVAFAAEVKAVAVKIASPDITHKSDIGAVRLGLTSPDAIRDAYVEVVSSAQENFPAARIVGVEIQEMVPSGVEVLIGLTRDEVLGPYLVVASGGVFTELLRDAARWPLPVSAREAEMLIGRLAVARLLDGYRGSGPHDQAALVDAVCRLSTIGTDLADAQPEIDLNPVIVGPRDLGVWVVDAVVHFGSPESDRTGVT